MRCAIELAQRGWGQTHPNPMVGAVLVENGEVVAQGWHERAGELHAERKLLQSLGRPPTSESILYVTLEPCSTIGRTLACTDMLLSSGLQKIVIGSIDPNPAHASRGLDLLLEGGMNVTSGVLAEDCADLNLIFNHAIRTGEPLFAAKIATTLDGKIATRSGQSHWITGESARQDVMRWRRYFSAIAVGAGTVLADNPRLTSRQQGQPEHCPLRFIFDRDLRSLIDPLPHVYSDEYADKTLVIHAPDAPPEKRHQLDSLGVGAWELPHTDHRPDLTAFKTLCYQSGIHGVWFEGGNTLLSHLLAERALDYLFHYRAPKLFADASALPAFSGQAPETVAQAIELKNIRHTIFAEDQLIRGFLKYPPESVR